VEYPAKAPSGNGVPRVVLATGFKHTPCMMRTAFVYDPLFLTHDTGRGHPERSERLQTSFSLVSQQEWYGSLYRLRPSPAPLDSIQAIHRPDYIERAGAACRAGQSRLDTPDVSISRSSYEVALNAAGSVLEVADQVMEGNVDNGFAMVRPPGHHAEAGFAMGFCLFNNIAVTARYLQHRHGLERVLILDWDVHHGNGTQHTFEEDPGVFYMSLHQFPHYPGSGALSETGIGRGEGTTLNCPMSPGAGDAHYRQAFEEKILPAAIGFAPDAVLISAGFDAHHADPLGSINLETQSYVWMTRRMMELADRCCAGRLISVLEGGYDLTALAESITRHVHTLSQS